MSESRNPLDNLLKFFDVLADDAAKRDAEAAGRVENDVLREEIRRLFKLKLDVTKDEILNYLESLGRVRNQLKQNADQFEDKLRTVDGMLRGHGLNGTSDVTTRLATVLKWNADLLEEKHTTRAKARPQIEKIFDRYDISGNAAYDLINELVASLPLFSPDESEQSLRDGYKVMADLQKQRDAAHARVAGLRQTIEDQNGVLAQKDAEMAELRAKLEHYESVTKNVTLPRRFPIGSPVPPEDITEVRSEANGVRFWRTSSGEYWRATEESGGDGKAYSWHMLNGECAADGGMPLVEILN